MLRVRLPLFYESPEKCNKRQKCSNKLPQSSDYENSSLTNDINFVCDAFPQYEPRFVNLTVQLFPYFLLYLFGQ